MSSAIVIILLGIVGIFAAGLVPGLRLRYSLANEAYRNLAYIKNQCAKLAAQLADADHSEGG